MTKITYRAPQVRRAICSERDIAFNFEQIVGILDLLDNPAKPLTKEEAAGLPTVDPSRAWVRFKLTGAFDGGTYVAPATVIDSGGTALSPGETIDIYDGPQRYVGDVAGSEAGYAQQLRQPDGTLAWEPISLGGLAAGGGGGTDEKVKATSNDTTADYLLTKVHNASGSPPAYNASNHQEVFADEINDGGNERVRYYTDKVTTGADTFKVKVSGTDTTEEFLHDKVDQAGVAYDANLHSLVTFAVINGGGDESIRGFVEKANESGKVRTDATDALEYLEAKFPDTSVYNATTDELVYVQKIAGADLRLFTRSGSGNMTPKITIQGTGSPSDGDLAEPANGRYFDALAFGSPAWALANDPKVTDGRLFLYHGAEFNAVPIGDVTVNTVTRPGFRFDPLVTRTASGYCATDFTAADWSTMDAPTYGTGSFTIIKRATDGTRSKHATITGVECVLEETIDAGTLGHIEWEEGVWLLSPGCSKGSGYSE